MLYGVNVSCATLSVPFTKHNLQSQDKHATMRLSENYFTLISPARPFWIMIDYDAKAAFDRVISGITNIACQRFGLPKIAGNFMHHLLFNMSFYLVSGFGKSAKIFSNSADAPHIGKGGLQGSSSPCPIYIFNSGICLNTYKQCFTGASFIHPLTGKHISDHSVQFVDDTTQFINPLGTQPNQHASAPNMLDTPIFKLAQKNISEWNDIICLSGGK
jgi:hypothetical protein